MRRRDWYRWTVGDHDGATDRTPLTDGGDGQFRWVNDPPESRFRWGPDREEPTDQPRRDLDVFEERVADLEALDERLADLEDLASELELLAMNAHVKLARDDREGLREVVYDVEVAARRVDRAVEAARAAVDGPRTATDEGSVDEPESTGERASSVSGVPGGRRASPQLPGGDRHPVGPWRVAGVDLTGWPGHLGEVDFERVHRAVPDSATAREGPVPEGVADFALEDDELSFEQVLALATADLPDGDTPG